MALSGFKLSLARVVDSPEGPEEELVQIGGIHPDWHDVSQALHDYYAGHGGADSVRREFKGGIRVEWVRGEDADAPIS
jgi:hypothetical protein